MQQITAKTAFNSSKLSTIKIAYVGAGVLWWFQTKAKPQQKIFAAYGSLPISIFYDE